MTVVKGVHCHCMHETWLLGSLSAMVQRHLLFHHGMVTKTNQRGRVSSGISIILVPSIIRTCNMSGKPPPVTSTSTSDLYVRMLGINLWFRNWSNKKSDQYHKRGKGNIKLFLARWNIMNQICSRRNWQDSTMSFPVMLNSYQSRTPAPMLASDPRCFEMCFDTKE